MISDTLIDSSSFFGNRPPETEKADIFEIFHGVSIEDPYQWLEDQQSRKTREWIDVQNGYSRSLMDRLPHRSQIEKDLESLMNTEYYGIPVKRGCKYFFRRRTVGQEQFAIILRDEKTGDEKVLYDPNPLSPDHTLQCEILDVSSDGTLMAVARRIGGRDEVSVIFMNVVTGTVIEDELPENRYFGLSIAPDCSGYYYDCNGNGGGGKVCFRKFGSSEEIVLFCREHSPQEIVFSRLSPSGRYLVITVIVGAGAGKTGVYLKDLQSDEPPATVLGIQNCRFYCDFAGEELIVHTDLDAPNGRVMKIVREKNGAFNLREIVPQTDAVISGMSLAGGRIIINYLKNVNSLLSVFDIDGRHLFNGSLPSIGTVSALSGEWREPEAFFSFTSYHIPPAIYRLNLNSLKMDIWHRAEIPVNGDDFEIRQVWFDSFDKVKIPMFLMRLKGCAPDGDSPVLLTGYGGFGLSRTPAYMPSAVLWARAGGTLALPALRGGGEFGEEWHRAGMLEKKQNVFDDFISAALWLIDNGYTNPSGLAISGRSNGGLLVGAVMAQRPELFRAVVCSYPLLDMLKYHRFLAGMYWVSEYGSSDEKEQFEYIHRYSPYHNIKPGVRYPAVLFVTGDGDTRVAPLHARKMTALMQEVSDMERPALLLYDVKNGHVGGQPLKKEIADLTDELSFLFWQLSVDYSGGNRR